MVSARSYVAYFLDQRAAEGCSVRTIEAYSEAIFRFVDDVSLAEIGDLGVPQAIEWGAMLLASTHPRTGRPVKTGTVNTYQRRVWSWFRWLHQQGFVEADIAAKVKKVKARDVTRRTVTGDQKEIAVRLARAKRENALRDVAILELLWGSGLRRSELAGLDFADVDFEEGTVNVLGKGQKRRIVGVPAAARLALWDYVLGKRVGGRALAGRGEDPGPLFLGRDRRRITANAVRLVVQRLGYRMEARMAPHDLRRGCAAFLMESGMRETSVMHQLGHEGVAMLRMYARESEERRAITEFHELDLRLR